VFTRLPASFVCYGDPVVCGLRPVWCVPTLFSTDFPQANPGLVLSFSFSSQLSRAFFDSGVNRMPPRRLRSSTRRGYKLPEVKEVTIPFALGLPSGPFFLFVYARHQLI